MKKLFIILVLSYVLIGTIGTNYVSATSTSIKDTGHADIIEFKFDDIYANCELLNMMSDYKIENAYDEVEKRAFGWSAKAITNNATGKYVSEIIFSKANSTTNELVYEYSLKNSDTEEYNVSTSGNISLKFSGKIKGVSAQVDSTLKKEVLLKTKKIYEEKTEFDVVVPQGKKVTLRVTGDCTVSNGVGKYFFLGICFKKGTWEYIDKTTEYYELYEENL